MEDEVYLYSESHKNVDISTLSERFGEPEEVAREFLNELGINEINRAYYFRQRFLIVTVAIIISVILLVSAVEVLTCFKQQRALNGHYTDSITYVGELSPGVTGPTYWVEEFGDE